MFCYWGNLLLYPTPKGKTFLSPPAALRIWELLKDLEPSGREIRRDKAEIVGPGEEGY